MSGTPGGGVQTPAIPVPQGLPPLGLTMPGIQTPNPGPGGNMMGVAQAGGMQMVPMQPMAGGGGGGGGASISLGLLLEHLVQKTYHELTVLSELLPRKMDMEKKIEIVKFARSTRQSFIRLLALVKWAGSAAKVDKCAAISLFLDQQSFLLVDTADMLSRMARENLVHARLPNFNLPHAVDVLTMRQYKRMPACIKERIVPPDPITSVEKETVLHRLDQIIQHRLVTSELPPQLANLTIEEGRVKFRVPQEFEVTLTLMEDNKTIPWRLLNIEILVQDPDTGDGKTLVHPIQVMCIHQLVQSRLFGDDKPLVDMYNVIHTFCQSLQLEVLYSQVQRLISERWGEHVTIDKYTAGECLMMSYWRSQSLHASKKPELFKLTVSIDDDDVAKPLQVLHDPPLDMVDAAHVNQAIRCDHLSVERLLVETVLVRSRLKLKGLQEELEKDLPGCKCHVEGSPSLLYIPVVKPCSEDEQLMVSVDMQTGSYIPSIAHCGSTLLDEIDQGLNHERSKLEPLIAKLRVLLYMRHCQYSVSMLPVTFLKELPLVTVSPEHPVNRLLPNYIYLRLTQHPQYYVVVDFALGKGLGDFLCRYHLMRCSSASYIDAQTIPQGGAAPSAQKDTPETTEKYLHPDVFVDLDHSTILRGPDTSVEDLDVDDDEKKRKVHHITAGEHKRKKLTSYCEFFNYTLSHVVSLCNIRIPFIKLCEELSQNNLAHQGIQVEGEGVGLVIKLCSLPPCKGVAKETSMALNAALLDCSFRLHKNQHGMWQVQMVFANCPVTSCSSREQGSTRLVYLFYKVLGSHSVVKQFQRDWDSIGRLYHLTLDLPIWLPYLTLSHSSRSSLIQDNPPFTTLVDIQSFTYQKITIAYGKDRSSTVMVCWDPDILRFRLIFSAVGSTSTANCHTMVQSYLEHELNEEQSLPKLIKSLCESQGPLHAICRLPLIPSLGLIAATNQVAGPIHKFALCPQSSTHYRVVFHNAYCLDIHCKGKNTVAVRDGAFSLFDMRKVVEGLYTVPNLKAFLELFIDETVSYHHQHRNSRTLPANEDDGNPISPMNIDAGPTPPDPYLPTQVSGYPSGASPMSRAGLGQGGSGGFAYPMTPPTAPGGPGSSNPATPASPHTSVLSQQQHYAMSPGAYPLASPPSIPGPSPSAVMKGTPSPGLVEGGSPFTSSMGLTMPSPGSRQWPGSPSMPGPSPVQRFGMAQSPGGSMGPSTHSPGSSGMTGQQGQVVPRQTRVLPPRNLATSLPTILSHEALHRMFTPAAIHGTPTTPLTYLCAPIERFLGSTYLQRHLKRVINAEQTQTLQAAEQGCRLKLTLLPPSDQGFHFKNDSLIFRVWLNPAHMQQLHLQVKQTPDAKERWSPDELHVIELYYENKVACPPFKPKAITSFARMLCAMPGVFKDLIQLMHLELQPDPSLKWSMQLCLTVPQGQTFAPVGIPAVVIKTKMLLFIQLSRQDTAPMVGQEAPSVIVPVLYDMQANTTQHISAIKPSVPTSQNDGTIATMLRRWAEFPNSAECTLFPAIRDLMANLNLPM
ncbi:mediator of RNA polymerase II transcription subunit 14 [Strongylocentrotus purpuratus]|uniref:Mediator of RNA polymerase II transcription subunit 14 n=1 Tax=Strongylocentrotus purpuratus TaxID=7668 RepID=A0A7M7NKA4_STRPU|nr:mediator of RNA polymerase II transcription subunit 14 [Strongylocentrotus purpuratus]